METRRSPFTGGRFALELDDKKPVGFLTSIDGGHFKSEAVSSLVGSEGGALRYPGKPTFDDITITVGMAMSPAFWKWVQASIDFRPERRSGAIVGYDFNNRERTRRTFHNALISEVGFPALDAGSKASAILTIKLAPEQLTYQEGDGSPLRYDQARDEDKRQKLWLASNFRFALERFKGDASLRSAKVEAFTVKQNIIANPIGHQLETRKEAGRVEVPALKVSFSEADVAGWMKWYDKAVRHGDHLKETTTGAITYYASDLERTELMRLELDGVGLTALELEKYEAQREGIARVKATLFVEKMKMVAGAGTA